jgi:hypothetical protein
MAAARAATKKVTAERTVVAQAVAMRAAEVRVVAAREKVGKGLLHLWKVLPP